MLKVNENPPLIWPQVESVQQFNGLWWVAHTKSRNEKALAQDLMAKNISYFLPMTWRVHRRSHRTIKALLPLFTGYLFFCGNEAERIELLKTNRVANLLEVKDQESLIHELVRFDQALRAGAPLTPHKYLNKGQWCRVIAGPLLADAALMSVPFFLCGGLKIIYDLLLYRSFRTVRPPEEQDQL